MNITKSVRSPYKMYKMYKMYNKCTKCTKCTGPWSATKHRPSASLLRRADLRCESNLPRRCRSTFARRRSPEETSRSQRCNIRMHVDPDSSDEEEIATRAALTAAGAILLQAQTDAKSSRSTNRECCSLYSAAKHLWSTCERHGVCPASTVLLPSFFPSDVQQIWVDWARRSPSTLADVPEEHRLRHCRMPMKCLPAGASTAVDKRLRSDRPTVVCTCVRDGNRSVISVGLSVMLSVLLCANTDTMQRQRHLHRARTRWVPLAEAPNAPSAAERVRLVRSGELNLTAVSLRSLLEETGAAE
jgi:hypothetical protein